MTNKQIKRNGLYNQVVGINESMNS